MVCAMPDFATKPLLTVIDVYQDATGLTESQVSHRLFSAGDKLPRLRDGTYDPRASTLSDAFIWLSQNWPDHLGVAWPRDISRPSRVVRSSRSPRRPARVSA